MSKKIILFVMDQLPMGGAVRVMLHLMNNIDRDIYDVHLALYKREGPFKDYMASDVTLHDLKSPSVKRGLFRFIRTLHHLKPDIVFCGIGHVSLAIAPLLPLLRRTLPQCSWVARETAIVSFETHNERHTGLFNWLYGTFYKNFDLIICQSKYMQNDLVTHYNVAFDQTKIIHNPLNIQEVQRLAAVVVKYPFSNESIRLLSVGRLSVQKRYDLLLEAFAKLDKKYTLVLVGSGEDEAELKSLTKELKLESRVSFEGYQSNPYAYMREADLFVLSSRYEGLPNVVLEANACGTPVVAFGCPGTEEVIENGVNGFLAPCLDVDKLADKIEEASTYSFSSSDIVELISEKYNINTIMQQYEMTLKKFL